MNAAIERAAAQDLPAVLALLGAVNLPTEGVAENFSQFFIARAHDSLIGCVGQERYDDVALLRSLAVDPQQQGGGWGRALTERLLTEARAAGIKEVVLLTTTARDFFARHFDFTETERRQFDEVFAGSPEWHLPRCSSAVCMRRRLGETSD